MALFSSRAREADFASKAAAGQKIWTYDFDSYVREKFVFAVEDIGRDGTGVDSYDLCQKVQYLVTRERGVQSLGRRSQPALDVESGLRAGDIDMVADILEAAWSVLAADPWAKTMTEGFTRTVNRVLLEHRVAYELVEGQLVEYHSRELHTAVVAPTLTLLAGRAGFDEVETAYRNALKEISQDPTDALTDAATALQQTLIALGCTGNTLGTVIKDAKKHGLLAPQDSPLLESVEKAGLWVAAERNINSDSHNVRHIPPDDAWLMVHIVGALILRLAGGAPRA